MSKLYISVRLIDENGDVHDWRATFDLLFEGVANTKNLIPRLSELVLREMVRRGLIAPTEGEVPRSSAEDNKPKRVKRGAGGKFASVLDGDEDGT